MQTGHADEGTLESDANLALAEQLKDHGLLADALYVKSTLAQLKEKWREARAHSDRALAFLRIKFPFSRLGCFSNVRQVVERRATHIWNGSWPPNDGPAPGLWRE